MGSLVLKSKNALVGSIQPLEFIFYKQRVLADGGVIINEQAVKDAIDFALSNNANELKVFSAVSPAWGIKFDGQNVQKLYSLFGEKGDCIVSGSYTAVNRDTNGMVFRGAVAQGLTTVGSITPTSSVSIIAKHKIGTHATYGSERSFNLAKMLSANAKKSSVENPYNSGLEVGYTRASTGDMPPSWTLRAFSEGLGATAATMTSVAEAERVTTVAGYSTKTGITLFKDGSELVSKASNRDFAQDMQILIGHSTNSFAYNYANSSPFLGEIYEIWVITDTDPQVAKKLSAR